MALLLALVGLFSVVSYGVTQRTAEFGVRMALGASRMHILWVAASSGIASAAAGIAVGVIADLSLRRIVTHWMNNRTAGIEALFAAVLLFTICTIPACLMPAGRASLIDPSDALRYE